MNIGYHYYTIKTLAVKAGFGEEEWLFLLCPTGIDMIKSVSHNYERHTLVPFHFTPIAPLPEIEGKQNEKEQNEVLIVELLYQAVEAAK